MTCILTFLNWIILIGTSIFLLGLSLSSFKEKEIRAGVISLFFFILNTAFWGWFLAASARFQTLNILDGINFTVKPAPHLNAGITAREGN